MLSIAPANKCWKLEASDFKIFQNLILVYTIHERFIESISIFIDSLNYYWKIKVLPNSLLTELYLLGTLLDLDYEMNWCISLAFIRNFLSLLVKVNQPQSANIFAILNILTPSSLHKEQKVETEKLPFLSSLILRSYS